MHSMSDPNRSLSLDHQSPFDSGSEYTEQNFKKLTLRGGRADHKEFDHCTFVRCSLSETAFNYCTFRDCMFKDCDLRLIHVKGSAFINVKFEGSEVSYVNWTEGAWAKTGLLNSISFARCNISYCTFIGLTLKSFAATGCTAHDVDFSETNLTGAILTDTDFSESRFLHTNLSGADLTSATGYAISPLDNQIKKAKFSLPQALSLLAALDIEIVDWEKKS